MKIFKGKKIYLMDDAFTIATGVVEDEGKIIEAGDFDDLINKYPQSRKSNEL